MICRTVISVFFFFPFRARQEKPRSGICILKVSNHVGHLSSKENHVGHLNSQMAEVISDVFSDREEILSAGTDEPKKKERHALA